MTLCLPLLSHTALSQELYRPPPSAIPGMKQHNNKPPGGQKKRVTTSLSSRKVLALTNSFHLLFSSLSFTEISASVFKERQVKDCRKERTNIGKSRKCHCFHKAILHAAMNWSKLGMRLQSGSPVSVVLYQHKPMQPPALARHCSNSYSSLNRLDLHLSVLPTWIGLHKKKHRKNINKHNTQL